MLETITLHSCTGSEINPYISEIARLRMQIFREYPYLYEGSLAYEEEYLQTYLNSPRSLVVLALHHHRVIGASTGIPLRDETPEFQQPFLTHGFDIEQIFYFGESVLEPSYRGKGLGIRFFEAREAYVQRLGGFRYTCFCAVVRPDNHPQRPLGYQPLDEFWKKRGYSKNPEFRTTFSWKELEEVDASPKMMEFWLKDWKESR